LNNMGDSKPLPLLLGTVLHDLERAYIQTGAERPGIPSLDLWFNLLRVLDESGVERSGLPTSLRLSKRAVSTRISTAKRYGWIEERRLGRGNISVRLTELGLKATARWKSVETSAEKAWREGIGPGRADGLLTALKEVVANLPLEHPHYPASYGPADANIIGRNGVDWKAVPRLSADSVSGLPAAALIAQVLVAFSMAYEERSPVAFSLSASIVMRIPAEGVSAHELGNSVGVSALVRHGFLHLSGAGRQALVHLTPRGTAVKTEHEELISAVESEWRSRFGAARIAALRSALEKIIAMPRETVC
jgi:hypothetical protein